MAWTSGNRRRAGLFAGGLALATGLAAGAFAAGEPLANLGAVGNDNGFGVRAEPYSLDYRYPRVAGVGDAVGDGSEDIIFGLPFAGSGSGYVSALVGTKLGIDMADPVPPPNAGFQTFDGLIFGGPFLGGSVSGAGDVNGDGLADFVASGDSRSGVTTAYVVYGVASGGLQNDPDLLQAGFGGFAINPINEGSAQTAMDVAGAGDVNGDGYGDLLIHLDQSGVGNNVATVYVAFGGPNMTTFNAGAVGASRPGFKIQTRATGDIFGGPYGFGPAGDVNGDGLADIVLGVKTEQPVLGTKGEVAVVFGKTDNAAVNLNLLEPGGFFVSYPVPVPGTAFGYAVAGAGDVNGDGYGDIIIGEADSFTQTGDAYIVFGAPGFDGINAQELRTGASTRGIFVVGNRDTATTEPVLLKGRIMSVSGAGDVDGDGLSDVLIGAPSAPSPLNESIFDAGQAFMVFGKSTPDRIDLAAFAGDFPTSPTYGNGARFYYGTRPVENVGIFTSGVGDITQEGLSSFAITATETAYISYPKIDAFETFFNTSRPTPEQATYSSFAKAGDAPIAGVGLTDGVQEQYPFSRAWIGFTGGDNISQQQVTLDRTGSSISGLSSVADTLGVAWLIESDRTGEESAQLVFHYLDSEVPDVIDGARESVLSVFRAPSPSGPWTRLAPTGLDITRNIVVTQSTITSGYYALGVRTQPPAKPVNPSPFNNQIVTVPDIDLSWIDGGGANSFDVYFGTPGNLTFRGTVTPPEALTFPITGLESNTEYSWRIDAVNEVGLTTGDTWTFRTAACKLPSISNPVPANSVTIPQPPAELAWTATKSGVFWEGPGCPLTYRVHFGATNPPVDTVIDAGTNTSASIAGLAEPGNTYYWQVEATDGVAPQFSTVFSFTVKKPGPADIIVLTEFTDAWVSGLEAGAFQPPVQLGFTGFQHDPLGKWVTRAGDVDGDGALDLITVTEFGEAWTALSTAANAVGPAVKQSVGWYVDPNAGYTVLAGDFDGDGRADLLRVNPGGELLWAINNNGTIPSPTQLQVTTLRHEPDEGFWMMAIDMNNDKMTDLVEVNNTEGRIRVALATGTGFESAQPWGTWVYRIDLAAKEALHFGDFNGDDRLDVVQIFDSSMHVGLFNHLTGTFNEPVFIGTVGYHDDSTRGEGWWVFTGDVDQDGLDDLIQINEFGEAWVSRSLGDGTFSTPPLRNAQLGFHHKPNGLWQIFIGKAKD
ncbi:MAG: hypothetical protein PWP23_2866 [Candidatus Sumerlaeota bacterium]|nr:hypothetical protein [Candidatus Sumerlaeota bacterium]